jgi:hypothetical protein
MTTAISPITSQFSTPYLTLDEFKNAPTALDYGNLVQGGSSAAQDAELTNAITRASSWIDQYCNQVLGATVDTEQQRTRIRPDGSVIFHPKYSPIVAVTQITMGTDPQAVTAVPDPSIAWIEESQVVFPYANANLTWSSAGPISFGAYASGRAPMFVKYTYVNGYANTTIATSASASATSLVVKNGTGIVAGQTLNIFDGVNTEQVTVASSYTFGSNTLPLTSGLLYAHGVGVSVSALPAAVKQAAILMTSAFLKIRGDASLVLSVTTRPGESIPGSQMIGTDRAVAEDLLKPFRRIR